MAQGPARSLSDHDRVEAFSRIKSLYELRRSKQTPPEYLATAKGMFAASPPREVFDLFNQMRLERYGSFCDLGSGDGMVVHIAALFTRAHGLEADPALVEMARDATRSLGLEERASFFLGDYLKRDLSNFDVLYIYPDRPGLDRLAERLTGSFSGFLVVFGPHFRPPKLARVREYEMDRGRAVVYTLEN